MLSLSAVIWTTALLKLRFFMWMRGVFGNQNIVIAFSFNIRFLNCTFQNFLHSGKPFVIKFTNPFLFVVYKQKNQPKPQKTVFNSLQLLLVLFSAQTLKILWYVKIFKQMSVKWIKDAFRHKRILLMIFFKKTMIKDRSHNKFTLMTSLWINSITRPAEILLTNRSITVVIL